MVYHQELAGRGPGWGRCQDLRKRIGNPGWKLGSRWRGPRDSHVQIYNLAGGLEHFYFSIIYGIILPIDFHIFQDG